jgi:hypothetical protein
MGLQRSRMTACSAIQYVVRTFRLELVPTYQTSRVVFLKTVVALGNKSYLLTYLLTYSMEQSPS